VASGNVSGGLEPGEGAEGRADRQPRDGDDLVDDDGTLEQRRPDRAVVRPPAAGAVS